MGRGCSAPTSNVSLTHTHFRHSVPGTKTSIPFLRPRPAILHAFSVRALYLMADFAAATRYHLKILQYVNLA